MQTWQNPIRLSGFMCRYSHPLLLARHKTHVFPFPSPGRVRRVVSKLCDFDLRERLRRDYCRCEILHNLGKVRTEVMSQVMASLSVAGAVPAALQSNVETSIRSCPSSTRVLVASRKSTAVSLRRCVAARASASEKEPQMWDMAKKAAVATAMSVVLATLPVQAAEDAFPGFPDSPAGESSKSILSEAKKKASDSFSEAQKTGKETTGQAASAGDAQPAISQVDPSAEEASDSVGDAIAAKADAAADLAPGTGQQTGKTGVNPFEKAFATPTRGLGDKEGENEARFSSLEQKNANKLPGEGTILGQKPGIIEKIKDTFKSAGEGRDAGVGLKPF